MNFKFVFLLIFISASCNNTSKAKFNDNYFEGELHFDLEFESYSDEYSIESLQTKYGIKMIQLIKHEEYLINYSFPDDLSNLKILFDLKNQLGLTEIKNHDTILQFELNKNQDELIFTKLDTTDQVNINGEQCNSVIIRYNSKSTSEDIDYIQAKYYYNSNYKINQEIFKNQNFNFLNLYYQLSNGSLILGDEVVYYPKYKIKHNLRKIKQRKIVDKELTLTKSKQIKKISPN